MTELEAAVSNLADTTFNDRLERVKVQAGCYSVIHDPSSNKIVFRWPGDARPVRIPVAQFIRLSERSETPRLAP